MNVVCSSVHVLALKTLQTQDAICQHPVCVKACASTPWSVFVQNRALAHRGIRPRTRLFKLHNEKEIDKNIFFNSDERAYAMYRPFRVEN